jgi:precorrin-6Y C5,15-methyltransferase (decarboxylating)
LSSLGRPDAIFIGGGLDAALFDAVWSMIPQGVRLVAHSVTLETESLLSELQQTHGGDLLRIVISHAAPLGRYRSWEAARPVVQWSVMK